MLHSVGNGTSMLTLYLSNFSASLWKPDSSVWNCSNVEGVLLAMMWLVGVAEPFWSLSNFGVGRGVEQVFSTNGKHCFQAFLSVWGLLSIHGEFPCM